ncbi:MAG: bifunctional 4-hydroxy-2-oxoglutarate aldolase/2-dehydro-3-deoxy-phosphogluconate aldolase [Halioglobus sp.]|nr:bifunctional 4-hydroxy-2-oxoglutarate aldolase/2-dehydro-3-deoxy-phosphogluconate aldolase [Halioglobus sp.]
MDFSILEVCRVIPVVSPRDVASTVKLARALQRGGMLAIEIALRTDAALESIRAVRAEVPGILVAAGTVIKPADLDLAMQAGAELVFSPGSSESLLQAALASGTAFVPGVGTASELMLGLHHGFGLFKLFPAEALGGKKLLQSFAGPFPRARFCPTGGLDENNFRSYLELSNVMCCGGSWMAADKLVSEGQWDAIEALARRAMS